MKELPIRFIPTRVGNTVEQHAPVILVTVHPHARGEHTLFAGDIKELVGSSPRAWGTLRQAHRRDSRLRFIPTRVGNTPDRQSKKRRRSVHPHARGEHHCDFHCDFHCDGSSPRAWGTRRRGKAHGR